MGEERSLRDKNAPENQESVAGKSRLRQSVELISSLISLSYSCKVFYVKWQSIRSRLDELNSGLVAAENYESSQNSTLSLLISDIMVTTNECYDLALRCVNLSYSGKLLMQSDLDVMSAKFDRHVTNLSGIYTAGILTHNYAIVVSRPAAGASKDDIRFYVRDLLTRMKVGDAEMKRQAMANLHEAVVEDEKYVKIILEVNEIIIISVNFLDAEEPEIQEHAAKLVSVIAGFHDYKGVLIGAGIMAPLIRVLECGSEVGKENAACCLQKLTENSDNVWSVSAHGGVSAMLKICASGCGGDCRGVLLINHACGVLKNLVGVEEIKRFMVEEGAISTFIKLLRTKDESVQIDSIEFLQMMAFGDEFIRQMVVREGGVRALMRVLDYNSSSSSKTREIGLRAIENLCLNSMNCISVLMRYGFIDQLLYFLRKGDVSIQELALKVAFRLCGASEEAKKAMGDVGFMPEFVRLLDAKSYGVREMAAEALSSLVSVPKNRKRFAQDDLNIGLLMQLLNPEEGNSGNKKFLLSTLLSLTSSNSGRRKIASSGYLKNIEKLAEAEVSDAKRLVKKLSTNKFLSMLSGIWHS